MIDINKNNRLFAEMLLELLEEKIRHSIHFRVRKRKRQMV